MSVGVLALKAMCALWGQQQYLNVPKNCRSAKLSACPPSVPGFFEVLDPCRKVRACDQLRLTGGLTDPELVKSDLDCDYV